MAEEDESDTHSDAIDISLYQIKDKRVTTSAEEEIGGIYDFEIQVDSRPWKV